MDLYGDMLGQCLVAPPHSQCESLDVMGLFGAALQTT